MQGEVQGQLEIGESDPPSLADPCKLAGEESVVGFLGFELEPEGPVTRLCAVANAGFGRPRAALFASDDISLPLSK